MERADAHFVECMPLSGGTEGYEITRIVHQENAGGTPAVLGTYKYTYISENTKIWGIPIIDGSIIALDADDAVNVGGGIVGINYNNASDDGELRFVEGDVIVINGTSNYDDAYTLTAGTSLTQLQFTSGFTAETFDGTETVVKLIESLHSSNGHMVQDSLGNLYYGHSLNTSGGSHYITKIETDGTQHPDYEWLTNTWDPVIAGGVYGLAITPDDHYLYVWFQGDFYLGYMYKFDLTTGDQVWANPATGFGFGGGGYDMAIDAAGNAYAPITVGTQFCSKFDAIDGSKTNLTLMGQGKESYVQYGCPYVALVDDDLGIVIAAGLQICSETQDESVLYNLAVRTFDDIKGAQIAVGGTFTSGGLDSTYLIGTGMVTVHDGFIYVLSYTPTCTLYKIAWDATAQTLTVVSSVAGPTYGQGIYFDLWGNLVVVNQDYATQHTDVIYFYDEDLNYLNKVDNMESLMFDSWASTVGGSWIQGDAVFNGILGTAEIPGTDDYWQIFTQSQDGATEEELLWTALIGEMVCILADGVVYPSRVVDDNGRINASDFATARKLHIGLNYESKLKPMKPVSQPDMMSAVVTCKQMGISVHNTDDIKYGVHDDDMKEINFDDVQWKNKCEIDGLFTGTVAVSVPDGFSVNCPLQITTSAPLPATVRAMIPKVD